MKRVLSGIQPSGAQHIGNYFGMMQKMVAYQDNADLFAFIANYHAMTSVQNGEELAKNTFETAATFLAIIYLKEPWLVVAAGLLSILGHMFPVFLRFKGGKGSAVGLGVLLAMAPDVFVLSIILVALLIALTRYVSIASIFGSMATTLLMFLFNKPLPYVLVTLLATLLILYKHIPNMKRLKNGTEPKLGAQGHV